MFLDFTLLSGPKEATVVAVRVIPEALLPSGSSLASSNWMLESTTSDFQGVGTSRLSAFFAR